MKPGVVIMHPLPCRGEIAGNIRLDPRVAMFEQMTYGVPVRMWLLNKGFENRHEINEDPEMTWEREVLIDEDLAVYSKLRSQRKKIDSQYRPIHYGMVIDKVFHGMGSIFCDLITQLFIPGFDKEKNKKIAPEDNGKPIKNVLIIEGHFLPDYFLAIISYLSERIIVNVMREGRFTKCRYSNISFIKGIGECVLDTCISRHDIEAEPMFWVVDKEYVRCYYCGKIFHKSNLL